MNGEPTQLLTPAEAASFLHMTDAELEALSALGKGPTVYLINGKPWFAMRDLIDWQILRRRGEQPKGE